MEYLSTATNKCEYIVWDAIRRKVQYWNNALVFSACHIKEQNKQSLAFDVCTTLHAVACTTSCMQNICKQNLRSLAILWRKMHVIHNICPMYITYTYRPMHEAMNYMHNDVQALWHMHVSDSMLIITLQIMNQGGRRKKYKSHCYVMYRKTNLTVSSYK